MGLWASYFFAKGALHFAGYLHVSVWWNLLFAALLVAPTPDHWSRRRAVVVARSAIHVAIAIALLWHDSWLPPLSEAVRFVANGGLPSGTFVVEFLLDSINPWIVGAGIALAGITVVADRYVRLTPLVLALLFIIGLQAWTTPKGEMDQKVKSFLAEESKRVVTFPAAGEQSPAFDIVFLHVCSLSWDDLREVGMENAEFFRQFDLILTNFNSVSAHSTITALRLLRSPCGQAAEGALYRTTQRECYLLDMLREIGYATWFAMNHEGRYLAFREEVRTWGHADAPMEIEDLPVLQHEFTGGPLRSDYVVIERWSEERERSAARKATLLYNTTTLHIGNRPLGENAGGDTRERYRQAVRLLFSDLDRVFSLLARSGRDTIVFFVPEHGASLRESRFQPAGLREVPLPTITLVPVGVKFVGRGWFPRGGLQPLQQVVDRPTSYLAIAAMVAQLTARQSLEIDDDALRALADKIPETKFVAETKAATVIRDAERYLLGSGPSGGAWVELSDELSAAGRSLYQNRL